MKETAKEALEQAQLYAAACVQQWKQMLTEQLTEHEYHSFLAEHAGLFLSAHLHDALVISKLKLGSELETDFVIVRDEYSLGLRYTLIEIEVPHCKLFTAPQKPTDRLNTALAQEHSWKQWIDTHPSEFLDLLPSKAMRHGGPPLLDFMILIGGWVSASRDNVLKTPV